MILWTSGRRSTNGKTGRVPSGWIGGSRRSSLASCEAVGCPLLRTADNHPGGPMCYSQHGSPSFAHASMIKARERGKRYTLAHALATRHPDARMVRIGAIGDPAGSLSLIGATLQAYETVKAEGLAFVGYTHGWRAKIAKPLRRILMASCDSLEDADLAISKGWRAAVVVPYDAPARFTTPAGHKAIVCPAMLAKGKVTCNQCRLCDASKSGPVICFRNHGPGSPSRAKMRNAIL